ncbi:MAG: hypothetical protein BWK72_19430 [Rhodoferax ferrireducens]|uniref:Helicase C-terminal domain-containing protein n=1 Tax=Rhodoferax ferrireducens TaxID=192843 RepID=A0A1W9KP94_9BURK|nr:MAG: hypothetical protein BWK72_19430 [Rhodoferax ferrireducens]
MKQVVNELAPDQKMQADWMRQLETARAILDRHSKGIHSVLLADEVGMGKTYAALAAIALHLFQTDKNDRKVLLVVPNALLSSKWEQEIRTFNRDYLLRREGKELRPLIVSGYWDLVQNLHDYQNIDVPRISERMLRCFTFLVKEWFDGSRRKAYKRKTQWPICNGLHELHSDVLELTSYLSPLALSNFLDDQISLEPDRFKNMAQDLEAGKPSEFLKQLFRTFGSRQDAMEPNVFIVAMSALSRTRSDHSDARLFSSYIVSRGLKHRKSPVRLNVMGKVHAANLVSGPEAIKPLGKKRHLDWLNSIADTKLWGFEDAVDKEINKYGQETLVNELLGDHPNKTLKEISDRIIRRKLGEANIVLAVIDEVHNWKNGGNGAGEFSRMFRSQIPNKLMMSATPFQLHEEELGRVFSFVAAENDQSLKIVSGLIAPGGSASSCLKSSARFQAAWGNLTELEIREIQHLIDIHPENDDRSRQSMLLAQCKKGNLNDKLVAFVAALLDYHHAIRTLQDELSNIIIRHTKSRDKRHVHAGSEYSRTGAPDYTKPRSSLYPTTGLGDESGALLSYVGMRVEQLVRRDTVRSGREANAHILSGFSSSIGAFRESNSGLISAKGITDETKRYLSFFDSALSQTIHPKVAATVERAFSNYQAGSKTLIFCERLATQDEIVRNLREKIAATAFPSGSVEIAKRLRKEVLKDFQSIELYLSRSFRSAFPNVVGSPANRETIATEIDRHQVSLGRLSNRQRNKLIDLLVLDAEAPKNPTTELIRKLMVTEPALRAYLRLDKNPELDSFDDDPEDDDADEEFARGFDEISAGVCIWYPFPDSAAFHKLLWTLLSNECEQFSESAGNADPSAIAHLLLDLGQGLRKILLRLDTLRSLEPNQTKRPGAPIARMLALSAETPLISPWHRMLEFLRILIEAQGSIRRPQRHSSRRQSLWKGVYLRDEEIVSELHGEVKSDTRISRCAAFNSPLLPDILVCTAIGSEGIDLHLNCDEIIHHDLPWNPARFEQRTGRIDRVGSLAERLYRPGIRDHLLDIGVPFLAFDYDEFQFKTLLSRAQKFEVLLGKPEFTLDVDEHLDDPENSNSIVLDKDEASHTNESKLAVSLPKELVDMVRIDLSVASK